MTRVNRYQKIMYFLNFFSHLICFIELVLFQRRWKNIKSKFISMYTRVSVYAFLCIIICNQPERICYLLSKEIDILKKITYYRIVFSRVESFFS